MRATHLIVRISRGLLLFSAALAETPTWDRSVRTANNREPAIPRPEQDNAIAERLSALEKKTGRNPNMLPIGYRRNAWFAIVLGKLNAHAATFK